MYTWSDEGDVCLGVWQALDFSIDIGREALGSKKEPLKYLVFLAVEDYKYKANTGQKRFSSVELARKTNEKLFAQVLSKANEKTKDENQALRLARAAINRKNWRIDEKNWHRDWLPHFRKMQDILDTYDRDGLGPVAAELNKVQKVFDNLTQNCDDFPRFGKLPLDQVEKIRMSFKTNK
jgi:hypothetical protein